MNPENTLFDFILIILIMLVGCDFLARAIGSRAHAHYRRALGTAYNFIRTHVNRFVRWAWREHKKFLIGAVVGAIIALYLTGYFG